MLILFSALGAALGGIVRYLCMQGASRYLGDAFPWGTFLVNALGTFLLGAILGAGIQPADDWLSFDGLHAFAAIGFCGGLTTFSTFSLQTLTLVSEQAWPKVAANLLGSLVLCLLCGISGYALLERLTA